MGWHGPGRVHLDGVCVHVYGLPGRHVRGDSGKPRVPAVPRRDDGPARLDGLLESHRRAVDYLRSGAAR